MDGRPLQLDGRSLSLAALERFLRDAPSVEASLDVAARMAESRAVVERLVEQDAVMYGITTGFGKLANVQIAREDLATLQTNLVMSHAAGVGAPLGDDIARVMLLLKANALASGFSGVRFQVLEACLWLLNSKAVPFIPAQGSVGASGDLAPLAHLALILIGHPAGWVRDRDRSLTADRFLQENSREALQLGPKEGLGLLNGTQLTTALLATAMLRAEHFARAADVCAALSVEAFRGSQVPFDPRINRARGQQGQSAVAERIWGLLQGSPILESHADCDKVQDPYSFRCVPQVHGASRDALGFARQMCERELNAVTDNPLIFAEDNAVLSGGNFHAQPVALAADVLTIAVAEWASISERRVAQLIDPAASGLPAFLIEGSGLNSGFMIAQVTAAALVSETKTLAHPAVVDSIPTSANKEDHVSMGPWAGRKLHQALDHLEIVLAIELLAAVQGLDFHEGLKSTPALERVRAAVRVLVPHLDTDRPFSPDIAAVIPLVRSGLAMADG